MNEKEALTRVKTGNFNDGRGFDMQLLVDAVGIIGELFKSGKISEIVRCKNCVFRDDRDGMCEHVLQMRDPDWYCADGERKDDDG